ncbi:aspartyl-tRNA amidotransferase subunit B [Paludibacterium paludis]|uniref:Aspartyl-tRNA amidotransferase subunit B n=2 Tax=Paludibacterium paludis TaxID=1225769 RepID=A0A918U874_9NEIS|nr:aspartyl-tRNA amidotransferase subunit B [Paludibacterium paludis]
MPFVLSEYDCNPQFFPVSPIMSLKARISDDMKSAMKARESSRLAAIRLLMAAMKQKEVDERIELDDAAIIGVVDKMLKQRRDSIAQFEAAGRQDLVDKEKLEMDVLSSYLPEPLSDAEVDALISAAIETTGAVSMQDMGKVMGAVRPQMAGRADMGAVSARIKAALAR